AGAPAAGVEAAAGEVLYEAAVAGHQIAAVSAPDTGREVQPGRVDAAAGPPTRGRRGGPRDGGGRRPPRGELAVHVRSEVVDLRLDGALVDGGEAVGCRRRLRPGRAELGLRLTRARGVEREPLAGRLQLAPRALALREGHAGGGQEREAADRDSREFQPLNRHLRPPLLAPRLGGSLVGPESSLGSRRALLVCATSKTGVM